MAAGRDGDGSGDELDVVVVGAGFAGLYMLYRLRRLGFSTTVLESADDVGGTWYWNRYPGIHCDIESYVYMPLLEEVGYVPEWKYAPGEEIRQHARAIGRQFDLYRDALFHTQATDLRWNEADAEWTVSTDRGSRGPDGPRLRATARRRRTPRTT